MHVIIILTDRDVPMESDLPTPSSTDNLSLLAVSLESSSSDSDLSQRCVS